MEKADIKNLLRESLYSLEEETPMATHPAPEKKQDKEGNGKKIEKKIEHLTSKIKNATQGDGKILKLNWVFDKAGLGDAEDAADRSKYRQKVGNLNDRGLNYKEASAMAKVVDQPTAYT